MSKQGVAEINNEQSLNLAPEIDPLYLFASYLEWRIEGNPRSFQELLAARADANEEVRLIAESLLTQASPR